MDRSSKIPSLLALTTIALSPPLDMACGIEASAVASAVASVARQIGAKNAGAKRPLTKGMGHDNSSNRER